MHTIILSGGELGGLTWSLETEPAIGLEFNIDTQSYRVFDAVTKTTGSLTITTWYATWVGVQEQMNILSANIFPLAIANLPSDAPEELK